MKYFKAIAAMSENRVIGQGNTIPWHLPEDFKWFKSTTKGSVIVFGRKTMESLGRPLPNRTNLILTRHQRRFVNQHPQVFKGYELREWKGGEQIKVSYQLRFTSFEDPKKGAILVSNSLERIDPEEFNTAVFICGGAQIYEQALPRCSDLYLTLVKRVVEGDAFFPKFEDRFKLHAEILDAPEFKILHYRNRSLASEA